MAATTAELTAILWHGLAFLVSSGVRDLDEVPALRSGKAEFKRKKKRIDTGGEVPHERTEANLVLVINTALGAKYAGAPPVWAVVDHFATFQKRSSPGSALPQ